jgi:hypothetical protein
LLLYFAVLVMLVVLCITIFIERMVSFLCMLSELSVCYFGILRFSLGFCTIHVSVLRWKTGSYLEGMKIGNLHTCLITPVKSGVNYLCISEFNGKKSTYPHTLWMVEHLTTPPPPPPHTIKPGKEPPKLCNPMQITPLVVLVGGFDTLAG